MFAPSEDLIFNKDINALKERTRRGIMCILGRKLEDPKNEYWVNYCVCIKNNYFIQIMTTEKEDGLLIELSSSHYSSGRLNQAKLDIISSYGYEFGNKMNPNFHKTVTLTPDLLFELGDELTDIMYRVFDLEQHQPLKIEYDQDVYRAPSPFASRLFGWLRGIK